MDNDERFIAQIHDEQIETFKRMGPTGPYAALLYMQLLRKCAEWNRVYVSVPSGGMQALAEQLSAEFDMDSSLALNALAQLKARYMIYQKGERLYVFEAREHARVEKLGALRVRQCRRRKNCLGDALYSYTRAAAKTRHRNRSTDSAAPSIKPAIPEAHETPQELVAPDVTAKVPLGAKTTGEAAQRTPQPHAVTVTRNSDQANTGTGATSAPKPNAPAATRPTAGASTPAEPAARTSGASTATRPATGASAPAPPDDDDEWFDVDEIEESYI